MQLLGLIFASESWEPKIKYEKFGAHFEDFPALVSSDSLMQGCRGNLSLSHSPQPQHCPGPIRTEHSKCSTTFKLERIDLVVIVFLKIYFNSSASASLSSSNTSCTSNINNIKLHQGAEIRALLGSACRQHLTLTTSPCLGNLTRETSNL